MEYTTKLLNPTAIGDHFRVSSQKINLVLSELGFIEQDVAGWKVTKLGRTLGGSQHHHDISGKLYVLWPASILSNRNIRQVLNGTVTESTSKNETAVVNSSDNYRLKFPADHRTQDGHFVRSKAEVIIDNWLYQYQLVHSYERKLPIEEDVLCDFYIPSGNGRPQAVYIEYWGLESSEKYKERMKKKIEIYKKYEFPLIQLFEADIQNIDDVLPRKLLQFKIKVG